MTIHKSTTGKDLPAPTVEGPQKRQPSDLSSWCRIMDTNGSTIAYTPDDTTAQEIASKLPLTHVLDKAMYFLENILYDGICPSTHKLFPDANKFVEEMNTGTFQAPDLLAQVSRLREALEKILDEVETAADAEDIDVGFIENTATKALRGQEE